MKGDPVLVARPRALGTTDPHRWVHRGYEVALRVAILAAGLCPALSSLGGSVVAALLAAAGHLARRVEQPPSGSPLGSGPDLGSTR